MEMLDSAISRLKKRSGGEVSAEVLVGGLTDGLVCEGVLKMIVRRQGAPWGRYAGSRITTNKAQE